MSKLCSTGHPYVDGVPTCSCDEAAEPEGFVRYLVEPALDEGKKTVVTPHEPITKARRTTLVAERPAEPILSDDGWWQWDGSSWVPADVPPTGTPEPVAAAAPPVGSASGAGLVTAAAPVTSGVAVADPPPLGSMAGDAVPDWAAWSTPASAAKGPAPLTSSLSAPPVATLPPPAGAGYAPPAGSAYAPPVGSAYGPPPGPGYGPPTGWQSPPAPQPWGPPASGEREPFAVLALIFGILPPLVLVPTVLSIVFGVLARNRVKQNGKRGKVMATWGMSLAAAWIVVCVAAAVAVPVALNHAHGGPDGRVKADLRTAATAEASYYATHGAYGQAEQLDGRPKYPDDIRVSAAAQAYCIVGSPNGLQHYWYAGSAGVGLSTRWYPDYTSALGACATAVKAAVSSGASAGGTTSGRSA